MNDLYNETIERNGKIYHYDPDTDCYYCRYAPRGHWDTYGWIYASLVLAVICIYVEYLR
jgi:hypothetical protein